MPLIIYEGTFDFTSSVDAQEFFKRVEQMEDVQDVIIDREDAARVHVETPNPVVLASIIISADDCHGHPTDLKVVS